MSERVRASRSPDATLFYGLHEELLDDLKVSEKAKFIKSLLATDEEFIACLTSDKIFHSVRAQEPPFPLTFASQHPPFPMLPFLGREELWT